MTKKQKIFDGKLLKLYLEKRRFPNGYVANLEVIKHPGAVLIVPFLAKDRVVLIKQYRPVIDSHIWELPAGTLGKGEKPDACAKRELIEEIGYKTHALKRIGYIYPAPGYATEKIIIYVAHRLEKVQSILQEDEHIMPKVFSKKEIVRVFRSGKITDSKTIAALKLAEVI